MLAANVDAAAFEARKMFAAGQELDRILAGVRTRIALSDAELIAWRETILADFRRWLMWECEAPPTIH